MEKLNLEQEESRVSDTLLQKIRNSFLDSRQVLSLLVFIAVIFGILVVAFNFEGFIYFLVMGGYIFCIPVGIILVIILAYASGSSSKPKDPNSFSAKSPLKKIMLIVAAVGFPLLAVGLLLAVALG